VNILIFDHVRQAVGAEQNDIVGQDIKLLNLDLHRGLDAQCPGYVISVCGALRLFLGIKAPIDKLLQQGVIECELLEFGAAKSVRPGIANVAKAEEAAALAAAEEKVDVKVDVSVKMPESEQPAPASASASAPAPAPAHTSTAVGIDASSAPNALPSARLQVLSGAFAGRELELTKALTTLGRPGVQVAAITRRPEGYFVVHVESGEEGDYPLVNGQPIGAQARKLSDNDVLQLAGVKMGFFSA